MKPKLKRIAEQTIVITGASSGIGLATAYLAARQGARLVLAARSKNALGQIVREIQSEGGDAIAVTADVANATDVEQIANAAKERYGGFDTWVNNAGVSIYGKILEVPVDEQRRVFETNYWGVVNGSLAAARHLRDRGGAIINIGSILSDRAVPLQGGYSASKHAVKGFTDALRMELEEAALPISVTLIKPGAIDTPYTEHAKNYLDVEPKHPSPVYAPEVVAEAILHCAENPVRDLVVGGGGKFFTVFGQYAPRLADKAMEWLASDFQRGEKPSSRQRSGLSEPSEDPRTRGNHDGHVSANSLYTKAAMYPGITSALLLAGLGLSYVVAKNLRNTRPETNGNSGRIRS